MSVDYQLNINPLELLEQYLDHEILPSGVSFWISEVDTLENVFVNATMPVAINGATITIDFLHEAVNLMELKTPAAIFQKVRILVGNVWCKYGKVFSTFAESRINAANNGVPWYKI